MAWKVSALVLLALASCGVCQRQFVPFSCQRANSPCAFANGGRCLPDGSCLCTNGQFEGYNCGLAVASKVVTNCNVNCQNGGQCYDEGNGHSCYCMPAYYGPLCERSRVAILGCSDTSMTILVNPHGAFSGAIFVRGLRGAPACRVDVAATSPLQGYTKTLSLSTVGNANPCLARMDTLGNGGIKRYSVVVQYDPIFIGWPDEIHTFQCTQSATGNTVGLVVSGLIFDTSTDTLLTGLNLNANHVPVRLQITRQPNRTPLDSSIQRIGEDLFLEVTLSQTSVYTSVRVEGLTVFDNNINAQRSKVLVTDSCLNSLTNGITVNPLLRPSAGVVLVPFKMFKFTTTDSVYFFVSTVMCTDANLADCNPVNCDGLPNGHGRKKRQAAPVQGNVTTRVFVVSPGDTTVDLTSCSRDAVEPAHYPSCFHNPTFMIVTVMLGLLLLVALVVLVMICLRWRKRHLKDEREGQAYSNPATDRM